MKILVLTSVYPQPDDGNDIVTATVKYFCEKWSNEGHEVIVIHNNSSFPYLFYLIPNKLRSYFSSKLGHNFPNKDSRKEIYHKDNGIKVYRLPMVKCIPHGKFSKMAIDKQINKIEKIIISENFVPDVVVSHWINPQIELVPAIANKYGARSSIVFHGDCSDKNIEKFDLMNNINKFDVVGCRNKSYAEYVKNKLQLNKLPFICYSGIPDDLAEREKNCKRDFICTSDFLYVGRLIEYKRIDVIIKALSNVYKNRDFRLHIVGEGAEKESLQKLCKNLGVEKKVIFYGQMSRNDVFELMKKCFSFIMVSENETFGMVYLEAMLAGCVTIASKNGGIDGIIKDNENGFLSTQGDVADLERTLTKIINMKKDLIYKIRNNAILTAVNYSDSNVAKVYLDNVLDE